MISFGKSVRDTQDPLNRIPIKQLYDMIRNNNSELSNLIRQLRNIVTIDPKQYAQLKTRLPFFVCGLFNPAFRKGDNFAYTDYFCVDIDHITQKELNVKTLKRPTHQR